MSLEQDSLKYYHFAPSGGYSLDPKRSDNYLNFVLMYQVVGTLLRNGRNGEYEPYLAKAWRISEDGTTFFFRIKDNVFSQNGKEINAKSYSKVFHFLAKYLSDNGKESLVQFDRLIGISEYFAGKSPTISGIVVNENENEISFRFMEKPDDLLIAFTEPYFGFYNLDDFDGFNGLRNQNTLDASGLFKIEQVSEDRRTIKLTRINQDNENRIRKLEMMLFKKSEEFLEHSGEDKIIFGMTEFNDSWKEKFKIIQSDPNMLGAIVLSPLLKPFHGLAIRQSIRNAVYKWYNKIEFNSPRASLGGQFNFLSKPSRSPWQQMNGDLNVEKMRSKGLEIIEVAYFNLFETEVNYLNLLFSHIESETGIQLKLKQVDRSEDGMFERVVSDEKFASRFSTVVVGGSASNQNNKMMFCSKLGVQFKDPSGRLCKLIESSEQKSGLVDDDYVQNFTEILWEDAVVLPIFHLGFFWLSSRKLQSEVLRSGMGMPRLDLVE